MPYLQPIEWEGEDHEPVFYKSKPRIKLKKSTMPNKDHAKGFNYQLPWWPVARQPDTILWIELCVAGWSLLGATITKTGVSFSLLGFGVCWWWETE